ncbi:helix-turn-helix domain-containing protein [Pontibacter sp. H259]|uniref:helix-turn-helix domain-containing protein n=1 Tax=Pontibacter sp. H259 TaxID=3133421 RepID=UPI0030C40E64
MSQLMYTKEFFNVPEAAQYLDLSEDAVYRLIQGQKLKHSRPNGKRIYIERAHCDAYMRLNTVRTIDEIQQEAVLRTQKKGGKKW